MSTKVLLEDVRARLVEAVLVGRLDADRARAIFAGVEAHSQEIAAWVEPRVPDP